jgi:GAF domain-containing protein/anti-sigma regulatory factor (Ser/Thr protein kinase)
MDMESSAISLLVAPHRRPPAGAAFAAPLGEAGSHRAGGRRRRPRRDPATELAFLTGSTLDPAVTAQEIVDLVVPDFADYATLLLREDVLTESADARVRPEPVALRRLALATESAELTARLWAAEPMAAPTVIGPDSPYARCMASRSVLVEPRTHPAGGPDAPGLAGDPELARLLNARCGVFAPLVAGADVLGVLVLSRCPEEDRFDPGEIDYAAHVAARAAAWLDNARRFSRQQRTALVMQKALLPQNLAEPDGLEIAHRYLPASEIEVVGGDWFDVIALSGGRTALVVGDVMGHSTAAASAMGQLRTAVRTLAGVDLPPAQVLTHLDELMPHIDESLFATCIYAIYDPTTHKCVLSRAGHVPPLIVLPGQPPEVLHRVRPGLPLGLRVDYSPYDTVEIDMPEGALLVLCTDGLLENKNRDIDTGLDLLCENVARSKRPLEAICDQVVRELDLNKDRDDIALLVARVYPPTRGLSAAWDLPASADQVPRCRRLVRDTLADWGLGHLIETTTLLVSELVTNALLHSGGNFQLRLHKGKILLCEVCDDERLPPRLHTEGPDRLDLLAEDGRGMVLVSELSRRWGFRPTAAGKVVWFELPIAK